MAARMRGRRARLGALAAACAAMLALAVALGVTQRGDAPGATAQTTTTATTCTARTLGVSRTANPGLAADCDTLLAIKSTLRVTGWLDYDRADWRDHGAWLNWSAAAPMRFWQVITLGGTPQRVTGLDFSDTRESVKVYHARLRRFVDSEHYTRQWTLRGVIPTQLGNLTALETLDLGGSELTGVIPTQLGSLTKLTRLDLSDNRLTGSIPTQLGSLTALTALDLSGNSLRGSIPTQLGSLTALESLDLAGNSLRGSLPAWTASLTKLTALDVRNNSLAGNLPAGLRDLPPTLATLHLSGNSFTGCIDERLRLAETNDLATLMKARSLSWCSVTTMPSSVLIRAGTYQFEVPRGGAIMDVPGGGPPIALTRQMLDDSGISLCFTTLTGENRLCLDETSGVETLRWIESDVTGGSSQMTVEDLFDEISASARRAP